MPYASHQNRKVFMSVYVFMNYVESGGKTILIFARRRYMACERGGEAFQMRNVLVDKNNKIRL